ncbi:MAG TPA: hypothetical protein PK156_00245 [Polyangium sp.]|nr:hypothetical protein [Polyangium sp.]
MFAGTHAIPDELDELDELDEVIPDEELDDELDEEDELEEEDDVDVDGSVSPHPAARAMEVPTIANSAACCLERERKCCMDYP